MKRVKILLSVVIAVIVMLFAGCEEEKGPINVNAEMTPSVAKSGEHITLKVKVTNQASGGSFFTQAESVRIQEIIFHEEFASGPRQYRGYMRNLFPSPSTKTVSPGSSAIVLSKTFKVENTDYEEDLKIKGFVEVKTYSAGSDRDEFIYTIEHK